jgi:hypothetical protein
VSIDNRYNRPVEFVASIATASFIRKPSLSLVWEFRASDGTVVYSGTRTVLPSNNYTLTVPYFDAAKLLVLGSYTFSCWYTDDGIIVSGTTTSNTVNRTAIAGMELDVAWSSDKNTVEFRAATPYVCKRKMTLDTWSYWAPEDGATPEDSQSIDVLKANAGTKPTITLNTRMKQVPVVYYKWTVIGMYDNGTVAYTTGGSGSLVKGMVFQMGDEIMRCDVIYPDGTMVEQFVDVIE